MSTHRSEGIILRVQPFKERDQILTVFSLDQGLIKIILKGNSQSGSAAVLTRAEFVYVKKNSDLFSCQEMSILHYNLGIRNSLASLDVAFGMIKGLLTSQPQHLPAPLLYSLFLTYLEHLSSIENPEILAASFKLKILRHEGLLTMEPTSPLHGLAFCRTFTELQNVKITPEIKTQVDNLFDLAF